VVIGRASEYFDFFVYAIASVLVFPSVFFPTKAGLTAHYTLLPFLRLPLLPGRSELWHLWQFSTVSPVKPS
jgi:hypothetical protein